MHRIGSSPATAAHSTVFADPAFAAKTTWIAQLEKQWGSPIKLTEWPLANIPDRDRQESAAEYVTYVRYKAEAVTAHTTS